MDGNMVMIFLAVTGALAVILWERIRTKRVMDTLDKMLDDAICGVFAQERFDESRLSGVEAKLSKYLSASVVSARNVAEEKDKIKTLIADISHQTKTPLANVLLYAGLLEEQPLTEQGRRCVEALESQAEKLQILIEALVKTSRLETGVLAMHPEPGRLSAIVESAAAQLMPKAAEKDIALTVVPGETEALCDPKWTREAVCNLLDNAVKYTPAGGRVTVETAAYEMFSRITVTDTGAGIPEEEQAKVFRRFYRGAAHYGDEGVGIGLYLVRQIAAEQGGYVKVSSQSGKGSAFSLYLPRG
jgi:signal transduction histidine kinase